MNSSMRRVSTLSSHYPFPTAITYPYAANTLLSLTRRPLFKGGRMIYDPITHFENEWHYHYQLETYEHRRDMKVLGAGGASLINKGGNPLRENSSRAHSALREAEDV